MSTILIVDDDHAVLDDTRTYLKHMGYDVLCADNAGLAWSYISSASLDCVILDIMLPDEDGFDLCTRIRQRSGLPVIFLSGYTEEENRIRGLSIGGDDFVGKPYSLAELELRIQARIHARSILRPPDVLTYGCLAIIPADRTVTFQNSCTELSVNEFDVLYFLARHPGQVFSYDQIFDQVWHCPVNKGLKALQMVIVRIRQKLNGISPEHEYIRTVRRKGYLFMP